jgi:hypothetical protein
MTRNLGPLSLVVLSISGCAVESAPERDVAVGRASQSVSTCPDDPECEGAPRSDWLPYPDLVAGGEVDADGQLVVNPYSTQPSDLCIRPAGDRFHLIVRTYNHGNAPATHGTTTLVRFPYYSGYIYQTVAVPPLDAGAYSDSIIPLPSLPVDFWIQVDSYPVPGSVTGQVLESNESNWFHGSCFY